MNELFVVTPGTEQISLRIDDSTEKVLSIEETFALRSALTRAVSVAHHPKGPFDGVYFDKVDDVWAYIPIAKGETCMGIYVLAKRNGVFMSTMFDWLGQSPLLFSSSRPNMAGLRPYILVKDFRSLQPYLAIFRGFYRDRFLEDCGLSRAVYGDEVFDEAAEGPDGSLIFISHGTLKDGRTRQSVRVVSLCTGRHFTRYYFSDDARYPFVLRDDLPRISEDEVVRIASDAATSWYDMLVETVRPWFPDGEGA